MTFKTKDGRSLPVSVVPVGHYLSQYAFKNSTRFLDVHGICMSPHRPRQGLFALFNYPEKILFDTIQSYIHEFDITHIFSYHAAPELYWDGLNKVKKAIWDLGFIRGESDPFNAGQHPHKTFWNDLEKSI